MTEPTPSRGTLVDQLADVIADAVCQNGIPTRDIAAQALEWLKEHGWLRPPERQQIFAELAALRSLLGLQPGEHVCGARSRDNDGNLDAMVCLLPAGHRDEGHWHRGVGGSWSL